MNSLRARKFLKRLLWTGSSILLLGLVLLLSAPWWTEAALRRFGNDIGLNFERYERIGYGEFALHELKFDNETLLISAEETKLPSLPALLVNKLLSKQITVSSQGIRVTTNEAFEGSENDGSANNNVPELSSTLLQYLDELDNWKLRIELNDLEYSAKQLDAYIPHFEYIDGELSAAITSSQLEETARLTVSREARSLTQIRLTTEPSLLALEIDARQTDTNKTELNGNIIWQAWTGDFSATWIESGWLPERASFSANEWPLPDSVLSPENRHGYTAPKVSINVGWSDENYKLSVQADAEPEDANQERLRVNLQAQGDADKITVETINIQGGWIQGELYEPVSISYENFEDLPSFGFALSVDFDRQSLFPAKGSAELRIKADDRPGDQYPLITALFSGRELEYENYKLSLLQIESILDWPNLEVNRCEASLGEDSELSITGQYDLESETIESLKAEAELSGRLLEQFGITEPKLEKAMLKLTAEGPRERPLHEGSLRIEKLAWADDLINADIAWKGEHGALEFVNGNAQGEQVELEWVGQADIGLSEQKVLLKSAKVTPNGLNVVSLLQPFELIRTADGLIALKDFAVAGSGGGILSAEGAINYPQHGSLNVTGKNIQPIWLKLIREAELPFPMKWSKFDLKADWNDNPLTYVVNVEAIGYPQDQPPVTLKLSSHSNGENINIKQLELIQGTSKLLGAEGKFPLAIDLREEQLLQVDSKTPANFKLIAKPGATPLWQWLQSQYDLILDSPALNIEMQGNLEKPKGEITLTVDSVDFEEVTGLPHFPELTAIDIRTKLTPDSVLVDQFTLQVEGHPMQLTALQPMSQENWRLLLFEQKLPDWLEASGTLNFRDVPVTLFKDYLPPTIRTKGNIDLNANIEPGLVWSGHLSIQGIETLPINPIGSISSIGAELDLKGRTLTVESASASLGGRKLMIKGDIELLDDLTPSFDLAMQGSEIPFARAPGLIIRGSPDLTLKTDENGITTFAGSVFLNESFYTIDLTAITQTNVSDPNKRFPYFSITEEPINAWRLDMDIEGTEFMRIRTPVFEGIVSADFEIKGALEEPIATGQASIDQGVVLFPFANLRVDQGTLSVRQDDPHQPLVDLTASGRGYGYDLVMRLTGNPDDPQLTFSSTPSLEQSEILLMLTAGRIPDDNSRSSSSRLAGLGIFIGNTILVDMGILDPLDDGLQVFIGEDVTETGRDTLKVIYRIDQNWALVGEYDRFDEYNLDLKWTIYED